MAPPTETLDSEFREIVSASPGLSWKEMATQFKKERDALPPANERNGEERRTAERLDYFLSHTPIYYEKDDLVSVQKSSSLTGRVGSAASPRGPFLQYIRKNVFMESKDQLWSERKRVLDLVNCQSETSRIQSQTAATLASEVFHRKRTASPAADAPKDKRQNTSERTAELDAADEFEAEDSVSHVLTEPDLEAHILTVLFIKVNEQHEEQGSTMTISKEKALSLDLLRQRFGNIKQFESKKDMMYEGVNLSRWVRQAQGHLLSLCEKGQAPRWKKQDIADILLLNNIVLFAKNHPPSFIAQANRPKIANVWAQATAAFAEERMSLALPKSVADIRLIALVELAELHTGHSFERNMKKYAMDALAYPLALSKEWRRLTCCWLSGPCTYKAISKFERMSTFESTAEGADEDTEVHAVLHSLMDEIFDHPKLIMRWANGSSHSSKDHRAAYRQKPCGKKPDGRVLSNKSEQIFLETKSSKYADSAGQTLYDLFKLAQFCQGAINFKSKQKFQNFPCYGIQFLRDTIEIYQMDLSYDGIYTMVNLASCRVPRRLDDLCLLPPLIAAMLHIKSSYQDDCFWRSPVPSPKKHGKVALPQFLKP
ncbi:hypothetical protein BDZ88DRAFT_438073 [Geranomyces variabilis]|nr:hypothetical protein BDZ88DRAFT_438073 [Geranomyces variabilis]